MKELKKEIIKTLLYFDIFSFPLRAEEIHRYCGVKTTLRRVAEVLPELVKNGQLWQFGEYYLMRDKREWVSQRERNYRHSRVKLKTARRNAALISQFPFVRAVSISGSLSKYSADEAADIDYFIIVRSRRLWICRTLLHFFKKLTYLFGKQHDFCMNYFLGEEELELKDKNFYTALESITILPMYGLDMHKAFYRANPWVKSYFPNCNPLQQLAAPVEERPSLAKRLGELSFYKRWGHWANDGLHRLTIWWWRHKFSWKGFPMEHFDQDLRATPGESKYHPDDYQRHILKAYRQRLQEFEQLGLVPRSS